VTSAKRVWRTKTTEYNPRGCKYLISTYGIEPPTPLRWQQFKDLLPEHRTDHPLGCHRSRIPERVVFEKLVQVLVFGCAYERIADASCSEITLRRRTSRGKPTSCKARMFTVSTT